MRTKTLFGNLIVYAFLLLIVQKASSQGSRCPPMIIPLVTYQYEGDLKSAIGAEVNIWFVKKKCDCSGSWGNLCNLWGPTVDFKTQYYPEAKAVDVAAGFGYRSVFLKPELTTGYTILQEKYGKSFFHFDPQFGVDAAGVSLSVGYSFRTVEVADKTGAFFVRAAISPLLFFSHSKERRLLSAYSSAGKSQIKSVRASF